LLVGACYLYPIWRYLTRAREEADTRSRILRRMVLGAVISGVPLLATWGAVQWASVWAHQLGQQAVSAGTASVDSSRFWKEYTLMAASVGAIVGCVLGALLAGWQGRRLAYIVLCLASLASLLFFYRYNTTVDGIFFFSAFLMGACTASFYGWLPLFLPELFPTRVRATGQGFSFNFGRILAAVGVLQVPALMGDPPDYARACSSLAFIYLLGLVVIWLAPETYGKPLPE
jgi:hypothetical protein